VAVLAFDQVGTLPDPQAQPLVAQLLDDRVARAVAAGQVGTEAAEHPCEARHAGAADADQMDPVTADPEAHALVTPASRSTALIAAPVARDRRRCGRSRRRNGARPPRAPSSRAGPDRRAARRSRRAAAPGSPPPARARAPHRPARARWRCATAAGRGGAGTARRGPGGPTR